MMLQPLPAGGASRRITVLIVDAMGIQLHQSAVLHVGLGYGGAAYAAPEVVPHFPDQIVLLFEQLHLFDGLFAV